MCYRVKPGGNGGPKVGKKASDSAIDATDIDSGGWIGWRYQALRVDDDRRFFFCICYAQNGNTGTVAVEKGCCEKRWSYAKVQCAFVGLNGATRQEGDTLE